MNLCMRAVRLIGSCPLPSVSLFTGLVELAHRRACPRSHNLSGEALTLFSEQALKLGPLEASTCFLFYVEAFRATSERRAVESR
jgi:hypothetical protein